MAARTKKAAAKTPPADDPKPEAQAPLPQGAIPTVRVTKGDQVAIINKSDLDDWKAQGWK